MADAIGQVIAFAVVVSISPIPIIGVVLMLSSARARTNGPAFLAGWLAGLTVVGLIVIFVAGGAGIGDGDSAGSASTVKLVLGIVIVFLAARQWRSRPRNGEEAPEPAWMKAVDHFTPARAAALGVALSAINPKNLLLTVAAGVAISQTGVSNGDEIIALMVFVLIGTLGPGIPVVAYFAMGERSKQALDELQVWMSVNNNTIMAVVLLVIGAKLIGDGIGGF